MADCVIKATYLFAFCFCYLLSLQSDKFERVFRDLCNFAALHCNLQQSNKILRWTDTPKGEKWNWKPVLLRRKFTHYICFNNIFNTHSTRRKRVALTDHSGRQEHQLNYLKSGTAKQFWDSGGTISASILGGGGTKHFFLLTLYNFKNIGGRGTCPPPPHSAVPENHILLQFYMWILFWWEISRKYLIYLTCSRSV